MKNTAVVEKERKAASRSASEREENEKKKRSEKQTVKKAEKSEIGRVKSRGEKLGGKCADTETPTAENRKPVKHEKLYSVLTGASAGLINGVFGGGGGMIVVPMLVYLLKKEPRVAHATAILLILPMSIASGLLYASFGSFRWQTGLPVGIGVVIGGALGAVLLGKLSSKWIIVVFSLVMAAAGVKMLFF